MKNQKLVRDNIPDIIRKEGRKPLLRILDGKDLTDALCQKLLEEKLEYEAAVGDKEKLEELADILEVIFTLARQVGASDQDLLAVREKKNLARGGFSKGYFYLGDE